MENDSKIYEDTQSILWMLLSVLCLERKKQAEIINNIFVESLSFMTLSFKMKMELFIEMLYAYQRFWID